MLSVLAQVPVTAQTAEELRAAGVQLPDGPLTELAGQQLLLLREAFNRGGRLSYTPPPCHGRELNLDSPRCAGCVFFPSCWPVAGLDLADPDVRAKLQGMGVPDQVVAQVVRGGSS